jgi:molecular chaperone DnaJ
MAKRDYYEVLGLPKSAGPEEIRSAYRRLARQFHPDLNKEDPKAAEEKFKELSEAYEVLVDPAKRERYDRGGFAGVEQDFGPGGFRWQDFRHAGDVEDLFGDNEFLRQFFQQGGMGDLLGGLFGQAYVTRGAPARGRDLELTVRVPLSDVVRETTQTVEILRSDRCPDCEGTGAEHGRALEICKECGGQGQVRRTRVRGATQLISIVQCPTCHGTGKVILKRCPTCSGTGRVRRPRRLEIRIPPGIEDGAILRVAGEGEAGSGNRRGDLYVHIVIDPVKGIDREGRTLYSEATIDLSQALLGAHVSLPSLRGHVEVTVPPGTQPEATLRLRGEGLPPVGGGERGDHLVKVHVRLPTSLSSAQRDAVRDLFGAPSGEAVTREERGRGGFFGRRKG